MPDATASPLPGAAGPSVDQSGGPSSVDVDVVVIGAGQAGLAAAYHLRRVGLVPVGATPAGPDGPRTFVVLDDSPAAGGAWQHRWPSLTMEHVHGVHELPGAELPAADPDERASQVVGAYFAEYEQAHDVRVRRPVRVTAVRDLGGPARLLAVDTVQEDAVAGSVARTWRTRAVVNATGTWTSPFWPAYPGRETFAGRQLHTHDFRSADDFVGRRVIVVGGGTSGVQLLLQIAPVAAATTWVTRRPPLWRETEQLTPELGRVAVAQVDERTRAGLPPRSVVSVTGLPLTPVNRAGIAAGVLVARPMFERIVPDGAVWAPGTVPPQDEHVRADVILWCTGFRAALGHLRPLHLRGAGGGIVMAGQRSSRTRASSSSGMGRARRPSGPTGPDARRSATCGGSSGCEVVGPNPSG